MSYSREGNLKRDYHLGFFRDLSQYGLLHFGHTLGYSFLFRGTHSCPHRSHLYPSNIILAIIIAILLIVYNSNSKSL